MPDLGIRLQLLIGRTVPAPAPFEVVDALTDLEVRNNDDERDGFQMTFMLGRSGQALDYGLLKGGLLEPLNRVSIVAIIQGKPQVLINGVITQHQVMPSTRPGQTRLVVTGEDTGVLLDMEERSEVFRNLSDADIVGQVLDEYPELTPDVTSTSDTPSETQRVVAQQETDLGFVRRLARRNSFVFYTEPSSAPGQSTAYWGPKERPGEPAQPPLTMNMGSETNLDQLSFGYNALDPVTPRASVLEASSGRAIPVPTRPSLSPALANRSAQPLRTTVLRDTAGLDYIQAALQSLLATSESADAVTGNGELDAALYGRALRSRRQVTVRGVGQDYDGTYYVKQVTHRIKRGEYKQSFTLRREGRGATGSTV